MAGMAENEKIFLYKENYLFVIFFFFFANNNENTNISYLAKVVSAFITADKIIITPHTLPFWLSVYV